MEGGPEGERLRTWLARDWHGTMDWMAETPERRASVPGLWPGARSIVMLAMSYAPSADPLDATRRPDRGAISVYARGRDYHEVMKGRIKVLAGQIAALSGADAKAFVDTAPLMEKPLAARAGLGWQGKHTVLVSREHGGWLFLGAIVTAAALPPDPAEVDHCGGCARCLQACPTQAFPAPYMLDARRCISYLTIEHKGVIPRDLRPAIGNRIYGCDDCLAVCPWNKFAQAGREAKLTPRPELDAPSLALLAGLDDPGFRALFTASPVKRTGRDRFVRNVLVAIGNSGRADLAPDAVARLEDASALVRGMAVWALSRLLPPAAFRALQARHQAAETDADVQAEWAAA